MALDLIIPTEEIMVVTVEMFSRKMVFLKIVQMTSPLVRVELKKKEEKAVYGLHIRKQKMANLVTAVMLRTVHQVAVAVAAIMAAELVAGLVVVAVAPTLTQKRQK